MLCSRQASFDNKTYVEHIVRSELDAMSEAMTLKHGWSLVQVSVLSTKNTYRSSKSDISIGVSLTMLEVKHKEIFFTSTCHCIKTEDR